MADGVTFVMDGLEDLMRDLRELPQAMQTRVIKGTVATGASVIRKEAVRLAPEWTGAVSEGHPPPGTLKKSIYQTRLVEECNATTEAWKVDVRTGARMVAGRGKNKGKTFKMTAAYYALMVEYGHWTRAAGVSKRQHAKLRNANLVAESGARWVAPRPFMRPAFWGKKEEALRAMQDYLNENLKDATEVMRVLKAAGV